MTRTPIIWAAAALIFAVAQFRMIMLVIGSDYGASIDAANGVFHGTPHWVLYQNRILGPYTVGLLSYPFGSFVSAHVFYTIATTAVAGYLVLSLSWRRCGTDAAWGAFLLFHLLFALLLSKPWLYAWDQYDLIVFVLFAAFVISAKDWRWFAILFAVAIFNRESALFIALWMILDPLAKAWLRRQTPDWKMLGAGLGAMVCGIAVIASLRRILLVREVGPEMFHLPDLAGRSVHVKFADNIEFLHQTLTRFSYGFEILIPLFLVAVVALSVAVAMRDPGRYLALAATQIAMVGSIMALGVLQETRVLLDLVPFVVFGFGCLGSSRHDAAT